MTQEAKFTPCKVCGIPRRMYAEPKVEAGDRALETARKICTHLSYQARTHEYAPIAAMIQSAMNAQERGLLLLAGRLLESQSPEWGDVDGASIEEWLVEAGLLKQVDVSEPCDTENCVCAEFGFPTKCNRRTELGKRAIRLAAERGEGR